MEILVYIAAERQINEAIKRVGVSPETKRIVAVAIGNSNEEISALEVFFEQILKERSRDALLDEWSPERVEKVRSIYGVGLKELEATIRKNETPFKAIERLAIERSALLAVRK